MKKKLEKGTPIWVTVQFLRYIGFPNIIPQTENRINKSIFYFLEGIGLIRKGVIVESIEQKYVTDEGKESVKYIHKYYFRYKTSKHRQAF